MELTPREKDKLLIFTASLLAEPTDISIRLSPWMKAMSRVE